MKIIIGKVSCKPDSVKVDLLEHHPNSEIKLFPYKIVIPKDEFYRDFNAEYESILPELNEIAINCLNDSQLILCCEYFKLIIFDKYFNKLSDDKMYEYALNDWDDVIIDNDNIVISGQACPINFSGCKEAILIMTWVIVGIALVLGYFLGITPQALIYSQLSSV